MNVITDRKLFTPATPILCSDAKRLEKLLASLTPAERRWVRASGFDASPGTFALLPDAKGALRRVVAGVRDTADPWALAALPLKLPPGRYELGKGPAAIAPADAAFGWDLGAYQFARYRRA